MRGFATLLLDLTHKNEKSAIGFIVDIFLWIHSRYFFCCFLRRERGCHNAHFLSAGARLAARRTRGETKLSLRATHRFESTTHTFTPHMLPPTRQDSTPGDRIDSHGRRPVWQSTQLNIHLSFETSVWHARTSSSATQFGRGSTPGDWFRLECDGATGSRFQLGMAVSQHPDRGAANTTT